VRSSEEKDPSTMPFIPRTIRLLLRLGVAAVVLAGASTVALVVTGQPALAATGSDIANIAHAELGNGCAKYGSTPGTCNPDDPEWCADFARWVWRQAGVDYTTELNSFAVSFYSYGTRHNAIDSDPEVGDAVVYADNTTWNSGQANHVNLVYAVNGSQIQTIGGNEGNQVSFTSWFDWHNAANVIGAGRSERSSTPSASPSWRPGQSEDGRRGSLTSTPTARLRSSRSTRTATSTPTRTPTVYPAPRTAPTPGRHPDRARLHRSQPSPVR